MSTYTFIKNFLIKGTYSMMIMNSSLIKDLQLFMSYVEGCNNETSNDTYGLQDFS